MILGHRFQMTENDPTVDPQATVPLPLKILVYTLFVLLIVAAIAVGTRFVARNNAQDAETSQRAVAWELYLGSANGQTVKSATMDGRMLTLVVANPQGADHVVLVDTRKGEVVGRVVLAASP